MEIPRGLVFDWLAFVNLLAFVSMGIDKMLAVKRRSRVAERTLWLLALAGGFVGTILGGLAFHHKTSKAEFWIPVILSVGLWAAVYFYLQPFSLGF